MTEFCGIPLVCLRENSITELDLTSKGVGVPGAIVLSKLMPSATALTSLKCACAARKRSLVCQRLLICRLSLSLFFILPLARSLRKNGIGAEGATALATILKKTKITILECAAAPCSVFAFVSAP